MLSPTQKLKQYLASTLVMLVCPGRANASASRPRLAKSIIHHDVQCAVYSVQCAVYSVQCVVCSV